MRGRSWETGAVRLHRIRSLRLGLLFMSVVAALALAASGCGGGSSRPLSKSQYERKVQQIQQDVFAKINPATVIVSSRGGDATRGLEAVQHAIEDEARQLGQLTPPADIAKLHRRLVAAMRHYAEDLSSLIGALRSGRLTLDELGPKLRSLVSARAVRKARAEIIERGYKIGGSG
jgi:hypothetical protein